MDAAGDKNLFIRDEGLAIKPNRTGRNDKKIRVNEGGNSKTYYVSRDQFKAIGEAIQSNKSNDSSDINFKIKKITVQMEGNQATSATIKSKKGLTGGGNWAQKLASRVRGVETREKQTVTLLTPMAEAKDAITAINGEFFHHDDDLKKLKEIGRDHMKSVNSDSSLTRNLEEKIEIQLIKNPSFRKFLRESSELNPEEGAAKATLIAFINGNERLKELLNASLFDLAVETPKLSGRPIASELRVDSTSLTEDESIKIGVAEAKRDLEKIPQRRALEMGGGSTGIEDAKLIVDFFDKHLSALRADPNLKKEFIGKIKNHMDFNENLSVSRSNQTRLLTTPLQLEKIRRLNNFYTSERGFS